MAQIANGSSDVALQLQPANQLSLILSQMQMNNFNTGQMPVAEPVIKHVQKRSRKNVPVRYFHKWRKDSPCALIPNRDREERVRAMDPLDREVALGGRVRVCRPTDVPRVCEHVYRYENDSGRSMYQCSNCLAQWKQNTSQGGWRVAMHRGPCGTHSCRRNPEADILRDQVHEGGEQRPESRPMWHGLSLPQPPQLGLPQIVQDNLPAQQQALLPAQHAMLAVAQQMQLANLAQQLAGMPPMMPSSIMPGTATTGAVGLDQAGASKGPLGLSASTVAWLRQDPSIHQMVSMWSMQREDLARLGLMPLDLSLAGPTPGAGEPGSRTRHTQSEPSSVSHAGPNTYTGPPIACPTGTRGVPPDIPTVARGSFPCLIGGGKDRPGGGFQRTSGSQSSALKQGAQEAKPAAVFKKPVGGVKRSHPASEHISHPAKRSHPTSEEGQEVVSSSVQSTGSIAKRGSAKSGNAGSFWKHRSRMLGSSSVRPTSSAIGSSSTMGSSISVDSVLEADQHMDPECAKQKPVPESEKHNPDETTVEN